MLDVKNISIALGSFSLHDISFQVEAGEYFILLGESGVGKTVLLEIIAGLQHQNDGSIHKHGQDISKIDTQHRKIGIVYQDQALFPHMSVKDNIGYPLKCRNLEDDIFEKEILRLSAEVGICELLSRFPSTLSIGEAQRVALARTLATKPDILLLDEPLASLDVQAKPGLRSLLRKINRDGQTIIHVTHDYEEAIALASKIAVMENSSISQIGTPDDIFHKPKSEFIANFIGIKNFFKGEIKYSEISGTEFHANDLVFQIPDHTPSAAVIIIRSEDITVAKSQSDSSARNVFSGRIIDIEPVKSGVEIAIDIGMPIYAMITAKSVKHLELTNDDTVWVSFKASAVTIIKE